MDYSVFKNKFIAMTAEQKKQFIQSLPAIEVEALYKMPELFLYDKQIAPEGDWRYHLFMAGRGSGKTYAAATWLYSKIINGAQEVAIMGPDFSTLVKEIQPTFERLFPKNKKPKLNDKYHFYKCYNGCIVKLYTSDQEVRGNNAEYGWTEEICKWCDGNEAKIEERYDLFDLSIRVGKNPQIFNASTPKPISWFINYMKRIGQKDPLYSLTTGSTFDNIYLSESAKRAYESKFGGKRTGRQELYAELLTDTPGALWTNDMIIYTDGKPDCFRIVIAVDPAASNNANSDETGIVVVGLDKSNKAFVLEDASGRYSPDGWANKVQYLYGKYGADRVIAEKNNGGDMVKYTLQTVNKNLPIKLIQATKGKITRAEPVAALYEQKKVYHCAYFQTLERQMTSYTGDPKMSSPDRLDALVYALTELMLEPIYINRNINNLPNLQ